MDSKQALDARLPGTRKENNNTYKAKNIFSAGR